MVIFNIILSIKFVQIVKEPVYETTIAAKECNTRKTS